MAENKTQIVISAEDKTAAALASAKAGLDKFTGAYAALGTLAGIGAGGGLAAVIKSTIDFGDEMNDLSQKVGISVKNLGTWTLAADQSGTSMDTVAKGVKGLSQYMVSNRDAMKAAGITAKDANGAMIQLADIFQAMPDGIEKTNLAFKVFGKSGVDMIPLLNLGSKGLGEAAQKAEEYGRQLEALAPAADRFNDQLAELKLQSHAASINLATIVAGPMANWLEANNEAVRIAGGFGEALRLFAFNLDAMTTEKPVEEIKRLTKALDDYKEAGAIGKFIQSPTGYLFGGREDDLKKQIEFTKLLQRQDVMAAAAKLGDYRDARDLRRDGALTMSVAEATAKAQKLGSKKEEGETPLSRLLKEQRKRMAALNATAGDEQMVSADSVSRQYAAKEAEALEKLRSKYVELADPLQKYREQLDDITKLRDVGLLSTGLALEAEWAVNEAMQKQIDTMNGVGEKLKENASFARDFGLAFTSAAEDALVSGKELSEVVKGLGDDVARMIYRKKITEPLGNSVSSAIDGFDFGKLLGFATGGSFTVGGGGGTDTSLVAFRATPGERVTVTPPGRSHDGGGVVIQQHIYPSPGVSSGDLMQAMVAAKNAAIAEIHDSMRRGGSFA